MPFGKDVVENRRWAEGFKCRQHQSREIRSSEHESLPLASLGENTARINRQTSTDGVEPMDPAHETLIAVLKSIRDQADSVLKKIEQRGEQRSLSWKCARCNHVKHFTRPVSSEVASPCPRCKSDAFQRC